MKTNTCKVCQSTYHTKSRCPDNPEAVAKAKATKERMAEKARVKASEKPSKAVKPAKGKSTQAKKKASVTALKKKLEKLVKDYVKRRDDYTCQRCGKFVDGTNCHASHVIPVSRSGFLQFDPKNMKVLCYHDHINWWHKHPVEAGAWFTDKFPERWGYLERIHKERRKPMKADELQEKIDYYKELLNGNK